MPRFAHVPAAGAFAFTAVGSLAMLLLPAVACSRHDEDAEVDAGAHVSAPPVAPLAEFDAASASDGRAEAERAALLDAGHACGSKDLPDCPLQSWMKRHAKTLISFGDLSSIGEAFDEIAAFAPTSRLEDGGLEYPYWVSIAHDGAAAARAGDLNAAKGACRGCHTQYRATYHAWMRGRALPPERVDP